MRIACIADVHGNLSALFAVLKDIKRYSPDLILSLGDQVNFGPYPREVLELLQSEGVQMLLGNHELRQIDLIAGKDEALLTGINFKSARWTQEKIGDWPLEAMQLSRVIDGVTFAHSAPDNPFFALQYPSRLPALMSSLKTPCLVCGHQHNRWSYASGGKTLYAIGSVSLLENRLPGTAAYALVDIEGGQPLVRYMTTAYDASVMYDQFRSSGLADACPIMSRILHESILTGDATVMLFFAHLMPLLRDSGEKSITPQLWTLAADTFAWQTDGNCATYWKK